MRRFVSRLLLIALAVLGVVAALRFADVGSNAVVWMDDLNPDRLRHERFEVLRPTAVSVAASGSFEDVGDALAAGAWITDADGAVVWRQAPRRGSGTFATVADTLQLAAGIYDVYFASFGTGATAPPGDGAWGRLRHALTRGQAWRGDAGRWSVRIDGDRDALAHLPGSDDRRAERGAAWASGPLGNDEQATALLQVTEAARVSIRAVLEATPRAARDRAALVRLDGAAADTVWAFGYAGSEPAGGAPRNRRVDAERLLAPGVYRVAAATDARHAFGDWRATPPDAPWTWGVTLRADPAGAVGRLQPSDDFALPLVAAFACVGSDERLEDTFTLDARTEVMVTAAGEIFNDDGAYDWGWLDRVDGDGRAERLWELGYDNSVPAGGDAKNRMGLDVLTLAPGTYTLGYRSDSSHDCHGFNSEAPADRAFWGASLFALSPGFDADGVRRSQPAPTPSAPPRAGDDADLDETGEQTGDAAPRAPIAALERVALGADEATGFRAPESGRVLVSAHGRTAPGAPQAYGWMEDADGQTVWSARDPEHAGKRYAMSFVDLEPGASYTLRYRADPEPPESAFEIRSIRVVPIGD